MTRILGPIGRARSSACAFALVALATFSVGAAWAQDPALEPYSAEVRVDETASDAVTATEAARAAARRRAFGVVARRLAPRAAWARLDKVLAERSAQIGPQTAERASENVRPIVDAEIARAEAQLRVVSERATGVRYAATLDVSFRPDAMETLLADRGVPIVRPRPQPALLIPIYERGGGRTIFGGHDWAAAFERLSLARSVAPLTAPVGDFGDVRALGRRTPEIWEDVAALAARYAAPDVILARAEVAVDGGRARARVGAVRLSPDGPPRRLGFEIFKSGPADEIDRILEQAAVDVIGEVEDAYKSRVSGPGGAAGVVLVDARTQGFDAWVRLTRALEEVPSVSGTKTLAVMRQGALIEVRHLGGVERLSVELRERGLRVERAGEAEDGTEVLRVGSFSDPA